MGLVVALELHPMTQDEKLFFKQLGARIAALRKDQAMTQVQLAEAMDVSQQTVWPPGKWDGAACRSRTCRSSHAP